MEESGTPLQTSRDGDLPLLLLVDGDPFAAQALGEAVRGVVRFSYARHPDDADQLSESPAVILCDQHLAGQTGIAFLRQAAQRWPLAVRLLMAEDLQADELLAAINEAGVYRCVQKPWQPELWPAEDVRRWLRSALRQAALQQRSALFSQPPEPPPPTGFARLIRHRDSPLQQVVEMAQNVARFDLSVLITGDSGTGKEVLAQALHHGSRRAKGPFISENCGALPDSLLESELFGSKKGAYTGASEDRLGLFELANGGTLFLDEIGETSPAFQVKLLRVLQEGEVRPLGGRDRRAVSVRVIAATNRDLLDDARSGRFRQDLYYRLAGVVLHLPPLRQRRLDIPVLCEAILREAEQALSLSRRSLSEEALACCLAYDWPGNVRELRNELYRAMVLSDASGQRSETLYRHHFSPSLQEALHPLPLPPEVLTLREQVDALERQVIAKALHQHQGNISHAATALGLSRVGLRSKMERYGISAEAGL